MVCYGRGGPVDGCGLLESGHKRSDRATVGQTLATDKNKVGDTFAGTLTAPIQVEGKTVIPKGAKVTGRIVKVRKHELKVTLASVMVHGKSYQLETRGRIERPGQKQCQGCG